MSKPYGRCYWVEPGWLLAGVYPGAASPLEAKGKVDALLDAGIRAFADLTEAGEANWSGVPLAPYADVLEARAAARGVPVERRRFPIPDQGVTTAVRMEALLDWIDARIAAGQPVYVHCWGGKGRTGTAVGCWLVRHGLATAEDFVEVIAGLRRGDTGGGPAPENARQMGFVRDFTERFRSARREAAPDRALGCLVGLATGDAVGTALEFARPGTFEPIDDLVGGGPFGLEPGQWTDDTSMALCLAESIVERGDFDPRDQMERYVRWWKEGHLSSNGRCFDIGATVRTALGRFIETGEPFSGPTEENTAGNGSLMRLAPVPITWAGEPERAIALAGESSRTTHGARQAVDACRYYAGLIVGALNGVDKATLLSERYGPVPGLWDREPLHPKIDAVAAGSFKHREPPEIAGTGYVVLAMEAALWAFHRTDSFEAGCLRAANLGHDADTTAAIYGQLAGAYYGLAGIPPRWVARLSLLERITAIGEGLRGLSMEQ